MSEPWPFEQPPNCAVITLRSIVFGGSPILHVTHDLDDHGWQFLGLEDADAADPAVVSLRSMVTQDPTLFELHDLPPGWHAWRQAIGEPWTREPNPNTGEDE